MSNIIEDLLVQKVKESRTSGQDDVVIGNILKEEMQLFLLDFVYNTKKYSNLIMYGGTLLRIAYNLPRMSEDLDFVSSKEVDLIGLKEDLLKHFKDKYNADISIDINDRPTSYVKLLKIKFKLPEDLLAVKWNNELHIRFDINYFGDASKVTTETLPISRNILAFTIRTFPLSTLMATKIDAVLNRKVRMIGKDKLDCKPRDIYDLIWYLEKNIFPDIEYLKLKNYPFTNVKELFDEIKLRVLNLDDALFGKDLENLFLYKGEFESWQKSWRTRVLYLLNSYKVLEVGDLYEIRIGSDPLNQNVHIHFAFETIGTNKLIVFSITISSYWFDFSDLKIVPGQRVKEIENKITEIDHRTITDDEGEYIGLFYKKIIDFIKRNNNVLLRQEFRTKLIRATAENLDIKTQILLDRGLLEKVQFEELM